MITKPSIKPLPIMPQTRALKKKKDKKDEIIVAIS